MKISCDEKYPFYDVWDDDQDFAPSKHIAMTDQEEVEFKAIMEQFHIWQRILDLRYSNIADDAPVKHHGGKSTDRFFYPRTDAPEMDTK